MKKNLFSLLTAIVSVLLLCSFYSCTVTTSKSVGLATFNTNQKASISFITFEGTRVFNLNCQNSEKKISYSVKLESGSAKIFYECNGTKKELLTVNAGDTISDLSEPLQKGAVKIIIETNGTAKNGKFNFEIV